MKHDIKLTRQILLAVEEQQVHLQSTELSVEGYSADEIAKYVTRLVESGYIRALDDSGPDTSGWILLGLTEQGREFLDSFKNQATHSRT